MLLEQGCHIPDIFGLLLIDLRRPAIMYTLSRDSGSPLTLRRVSSTCHFHFSRLLKQHVLNRTKNRAAYQKSYWSLWGFQPWEDAETLNSSFNHRRPSKICNIQEVFCVKQYFFCITVSSQRFSAKNIGLKVLQSNKTQNFRHFS